MSILNSFNSISKPALKYESYLDTYESLFNCYKGKIVTFVEVGVLGGGSLQAWRNYFHPDSRIIGIDLNDSLKCELEKEGFEIYIGDQSDSVFWDSFFINVGVIDILLDDGGHTNFQQATTLLKSLPYIKDGGLILIEDVHTSYMTKFLNPSKFSFINFTKLCIDVINDRHYRLNNIKSQELIKKSIQYITFFESIVAFHVNRKKSYISDEKRFGEINDSNILPLDLREEGHNYNFINKFLKTLLPFLSNSIKKSFIGKKFKYLFYFDKNLNNENNKMKDYF